MITMLLGGLWHGANWQMVFWGALHGGALVVHKSFRDVSNRRNVHIPNGTLKQVVAVLWVGARDVLGGRLTGGQLMQFIIYAVLLATSVGALSELWGEGKLKSGDLILMAAFGSGFTWGSAVLRV